MTQFATETEFELDTEQDFTTDVSASSESTSQSAEDVMYAYLEAWRNSDFKVMHSLMTEQYRREGHEDPDDEGSTRHQLEPMIIEVIKAIRELQRETSLVSSEYIGDEFHFRLRTPGSDLPGVTDQGMPMFTPISYQHVKMRKENGVWRIYVAQFDHVSR